MRIYRKLAAALTAALLAGTLSFPAYGEVIVDNTRSAAVDELIEKGEKALETASAYGPAAAIEGLTAAQEEGNSDFDGPEVKKVDLRERYHEDYETYEESMADLFFLYSNIGNGGLTHEPVTIDIPANVVYTMEKDGLPYAYESRQYVYAKGTYVLRLTAVENAELPLSEQTEYQSVFRFRIQDAPPAKETESASTSVKTNSEPAETASTSIWGDTATQPEEDELPDTVSLSELSGREIETSDAESSGFEETEAAENITSEDDFPEETAAADTLPQLEGTRTQEYDALTGTYDVVLENGKQLTSTVPEGFIGAASVTIVTSPADEVLVSMYRNEEEIEFTNGGAYMENGRYRLDLDGCSYFFTIANYVNDMDYYPAPTGMRFTEARLGEEELTLASDQYLTMKEDGSYSFTLAGADGNRMEAVLIKDTVSPEFTIAVKGGQAQIQYLSNDIKQTVLEKDGAVVNFNGSTVSEPGNYRLTVTDMAGNAASQSFSLSYHVNMYGIFAAVLCILVIAGIVVFIIHTKKHMKIR